MKRLLIVLSFLVFSIPTTTSALGEWFNPINVTVQQDPYEKALQDSRASYASLSQLLARNITSAGTCGPIASQINSYKSQVRTMDTANPHVADRASQYLQYLYSSYDMCVANALAVQQQATYQAVSPTYTPPSGAGNTATYGNIKASAAFQEIQCSLRTNSQWNASTQSCDCLAGYSRSVAGSDCNQIQQAIQAQKTCATGQIMRPNGACMTYQASCETDYGSHSKWTGEKNSSGGAVCGCSDGYWLSSSDNWCLPIPPSVPAEQYYADHPDQNPVSSTGNQAATTSSVQTRHGFWTWLRGLFGF